MDETGKNAIISRQSEDSPIQPGERVAIPFTAEDARNLAELRQTSTAANTLRAYRNDWTRFCEWCAAREGDPRAATPENVAAYLASLCNEGLLYSSIARAAAGIGGQLEKYDRATWLSQPWQVKAVLKDLSKKLGRAPRYHKKPISIELLERGIAAAYPGDSIREARNRAILVFGYYIATRRSELAQLRFGSLNTEHFAKGIGLTLLRSKTDQEGAGFKKFVFWQPRARYCPVKCLMGWINGAGLLRGGLASNEAFVFRELTCVQRVLDRPMNPTCVSRAVKEVVAAIGLDPLAYGAHSLRAGFVTDAAGKGYSLEWIANQTGHRSIEQLRRYIRRLMPWEQNATEGFYERRWGEDDEDDDE
jgi:site-specific recombinase XerD